MKSKSSYEKVQSKSCLTHLWWIITPGLLFTKEIPSINQHFLFMLNSFGLIFTETFCDYKLFAFDKSIAEFRGYESLLQYIVFRGYLFYIEKIKFKLLQICCICTYLGEDMHKL